MVLLLRASTVAEILATMKSIEGSFATCHQNLVECLNDFDSRLANLTNSPPFSPLSLPPQPTTTTNSTFDVLLKKLETALMNVVVSTPTSESLFEDQNLPSSDERCDILDSAVPLKSSSSALIGDSPLLPCRAHHQLPLLVMKCPFSPLLNITYSHNKTDEDSSTPVLHSLVLTPPRCLKIGRIGPILRVFHGRAVITWFEEPPGSWSFEHITPLKSFGGSRANSDTLSSNNHHLNFDDGILWRHALISWAEESSEAVADANKVIELDHSMAKANLRKGVTCLKFEEYQTTKAAIETAQSVITPNNLPLVVDLPNQVAAATVSSTKPKCRHECYQKTEEMAVTISANFASEQQRLGVCDCACIVLRESLISIHSRLGTSAFVGDWIIFYATTSGLFFINGDECVLYLTPLYVEVLGLFVKYGYWVVGQHLVDESMVSILADDIDKVGSDGVLESSYITKVIHVYKRDPRFGGMSYVEKEEVCVLLRQDLNFWTYRPLFELMVRVAADDDPFLLNIYHMMIEKLHERSLFELLIRKGLIRSLHFNSNCDCLLMDEEYEGNVEATGEDYSVEPADTMRFFRALLDVGLLRTTNGNCVFGALKGALDAGVGIPHSEKRFAGFSKDSKQLDDEVHRKDIYGGHVAACMNSWMEGEPDKYLTHFSEYIKRGIEAANIKDLHKKVHAAIRADPTPKKSGKPHPILDRLLSRMLFWHKLQDNHHLEDKVVLKAWGNDTSNIPLVDLCQQPNIKDPTKPKEAYDTSPMPIDVRV